MGVIHKPVTILIGPHHFRILDVPCEVIEDRAFYGSKETNVIRQQISRAVLHMEMFDQHTIAFIARAMARPLANRIRAELGDEPFAEQHWPRWIDEARKCFDPKPAHFIDNVCDLAYSST